MAKSFDELVNRTTTAETRRRAARRTHELLAEMFLSELRQLSGRNQRQLAAALGIRQPSLSKLENQDDMQISTLQRIVEALGGQVDVLARFPTGTICLSQFDRPRRRASRSVPRKLKRHALRTNHRLIASSPPPPPAR
jgi:transcriptional regulator with XRE-family HTH domain